MRPHHPVPRRRVVLGMLGCIVMIGGFVWLGETLRHPPPAEPPLGPPAEAGGDPRLPVDCPERLPITASGPQEVTSGELLDCPALYDGRLVRYRGEAIGYLLQRRDGAWVQLNDDVYAAELGPLPTHREFHGANSGLGVFLPPNLAEQIGVLGGPQTRGDVLAVTGTFHRVDERGELAVINAVDGTVERPGGPVEEPGLRDRQIAALVAVIIALVAILNSRRAAARR